MNMKTPMRNPSPTANGEAPAKQVESRTPMGCETSMTVGGSAASSVEPIGEGLLDLGSPLGGVIDPVGLPFNGRGPVYVGERSLRPSPQRRLPPVVMVGDHPACGVGEAEMERQRGLIRLKTAVNNGTMTEEDGARMRGISNGNFWAFASGMSYGRGDAAWFGYSHLSRDIGAALCAWDDRVVPETPIRGVTGPTLDLGAFIREMRSFEFGIFKDKIMERGFSREDAQSVMNTPDADFWTSTLSMSLDDLIAAHKKGNHPTDLPALTGDAGQVEKASPIRRDVMFLAETIFGQDQEFEASVLDSLRTQIKAEWWLSQHKHGNSVQAVAMSAVLPFLKSEVAEGYKGWKFDPDFKEAMKVRLRLATWCLESGDGRQVFDIFLKETSVKFWKQVDDLSLAGFIDTAKERLEGLKDVPLPSPSKRKAKAVAEAKAEAKPFLLDEGLADFFKDSALLL